MNAPTDRFVAPAPEQATPTPRIDLHCHSRASTEADEALLIAINCPESYSEPEQVYRQAKQRGMAFVTITDHDSLNGVNTLAHHPDVLVGEELTCYFPEDRCKIHLLLWGLTPVQHAALQAVAADIYAVAHLVHEFDLAHAVAHPLYRQNDVLSRWHVERLLLLFKGFECLNGAHSTLHRDAFEPVVENLTRDSLKALEQLHNLPALGHTPWVKTRTGGSDDHGLFNIGRTYTEFPPGTDTIPKVLDCIRHARCWPAGEAGSSIKLAHNFYGVGIRYFTRNLADKSSPLVPLLDRMVGDNATTSRTSLALPLLKLAASQIFSRLTTALNPTPARGTALLQNLLLSAGRTHLSDYPTLTTSFKDGTVPLSHHEDVFSFMSDIQRQVATGLGGTMAKSIGTGNLGEIFDNLSAILAQQAILLPYYFALFHQNQERHLLASLTGRPLRPEGSPPRVALFTDDLTLPTPDALFANGLSSYATQHNLPVSIVSLASPSADTPAPHANHHTFKPLFTAPLTQIGQTVAIPPLLEILEHADRHQYDAIVINTSGLMAVAGYLVAKMLRIPLIFTPHDNLPQTVFHVSDGDYRLTEGAKGYFRWLCMASQTVIARSRTHLASLEPLALPPGRLQLAPTAAPQSETLDRTSAADVLAAQVKQPFRLIVHTDTPSKSDADLLVAIFHRLCTYRTDIALVAVGKGPWTGRIFAGLKGLPVYAAEVLPADLPHLYASAHLLLSPFTTDLTAAHTLTALHTGLPVLALKNTASADLVDEGLSGAILPPDPTPWAHAIIDLLNDEMRLSRLSRTASQRVARFTPGREYEHLLAECTRLVAASHSEMMNSPLASSTAAGGSAAAAGGLTPVTNEIPTERTAI